MRPLDLTVWKCHNCTKALKIWPSHFLHFKILFQKGEEDSESKDSDLSIYSGEEGDDSADNNDESDDGQETNDAEAKKDENYEEKEEAELRQVERMI